MLIFPIYVAQDMQFDSKALENNASGFNVEVGSRSENVSLSIMSSTKGHEKN